MYYKIFKKSYYEHFFLVFFLYNFCREKKTIFFNIEMISGGKTFIKTIGCSSTLLKVVPQENDASLTNQFFNI